MLTEDEVELNAEMGSFEYEDTALSMCDCCGREWWTDKYGKLWEVW